MPASFRNLKACDVELAFTLWHLGHLLGSVAHSLPGCMTRVFVCNTKESAFLSTSAKDLLMWASFDQIRFCNAVGFLSLNESVTEFC